MKKSIITLAIIASTSLGLVGTSNACSRLIADTPSHGITVARSYDWGGSELQSIAEVQPVGTSRTTKAVPEYKNPASWTVKYQTMSFTEVETFHNTTGEAINTEGLSASLLYQNPSKAFIKDVKDDGSAAVHMSDIVPFLVEQFATVEEVVEFFEAGNFQTAWTTGIGGHQHGFHFSVQDKSGDIALFQLNAGGKMVMHRGDVNSDLRVMANAPLQQDHRTYMKDFDMNDSTTLPSSISSADRNVRGMYATANTKFVDANAEWVDVRGKMKAMFDFGNKVPQDLVDPTNDESYTTWETYVYNLNSGDVTYYNEGNASQVSLSMSDVAEFTQPMCADIYTQAKTNGEVVFTPCS
ncbi:linear amide C-N hydrolase [Agarivorans sp. MS3-6]